jgi:hypothetical protein
MPYLRGGSDESPKRGKERLDKGKLAERALGFTRAIFCTKFERGGRLQTRTLPLGTAPFLSRTGVNRGVLLRISARVNAELVDADR